MFARTVACVRQAATCCKSLAVGISFASELDTAVADTGFALDTIRCGGAIPLALFLPPNSFRGNPLTFCVGIQVSEGLVALADTQIVRGSEQHNKGKLAVLRHQDDSFFLMTSGLRSVRDKAVIYLEEAMQSSTVEVNRLYQVANLFGEQLRRVKSEDGPALASSNYAFNLNAIIGGRLAGDEHPTLFYVYPEGNWIESSVDSPYFVIGRTPYAKPILDRLLDYENSLTEACALAVLSFNTTRTSVTDVDFPIDLISFPDNATVMSQHRFTEGEMQDATAWWEKKLAETLREFPMDWATPLNLKPKTNDPPE